MTTVTVFDDISLIPSFWFLGFHTLAEQGKIRLRIHHGNQAVVPNEDRKWKSTLFEVSTNGTTRRALIDIFDRFDSINPSVLDKTDQYFKFNFNSSFIETNIKSGKEKIFRMGYYFPVWYGRPWSPRVQVGSLLAGFQARRHVSLKQRSTDALYCYRERKSLFRKYSSLEYYTETLRNIEKRNHDFFWNVNYWGPALNDTYKSIANGNQRIAIMKILEKTRKEQPGYDLRYGFFDNKDANRDYPEYVMKPMLPTRDYLHVVASSKMSLVSRGLFDCFSWRVGEHMAMGRFALTERPLNETYVPLTEGTNAVFFENDLSDLEDKLLFYLKDSDRGVRIAKASQNYFDEHCRPEVQIKYMIDNLIPGSIR